jgi:imidazolonepropionase-like amidohydrolase
VEDQPVDAEFVQLALQHRTIVIPTLTVLDGYLRMYESVSSRVAPTVDDPNHCIDKLTLAKVAETATVDPKLVDATRAEARRKRGERFRIVTRANLGTLVTAGIPIATGTDAGNPLTLHGPAIYAEMEAMQAAGMTPMQVLVASTATASRAAGVANETGTVEKGKAADLLLLAADPIADVANLRRIRYVIRGGVVRSIDDLSARAK